MAHCSGCKVELCAANASPNSTRSSGWSDKCRECQRRYAKERRASGIVTRKPLTAEQIEARRAYMRRQYQKNRAHRIAQVIAYQKANPEKRKVWIARSHAKRAAIGHRVWYMRLEYGMSMEDYDALLQKQSGTCRLCRGMETVRDSKGNVKPLAVDHCHASGRVRALLCQRCNLLVGNLERIIKETAWAAEAFAYLEEHAGDDDRSARDWVRQRVLDYR